MFFLQKGLLAADRARRSTEPLCEPHEAALNWIHSISEQSTLGTGTQEER